jgi:hypothetical protein
MSIEFRRASALHLAGLWVLVSSWAVAVGWILSLFDSLDPFGYTVCLALILAAVFVVLRRCRIRWSALWRKIRVPRRRFARPLPAIFFVLLTLALIGGLIYPPNNYDYLTYRFTRILHWWSERGWHWIASNDGRLNFSGTGMEWLMMPLFVYTRSDVFFPLINIVSYSLMPGLIFSVLRQLGVRPKIAWQWMWLFPGAYCYVMQAGSAGNDAFAVVYFLAGLAFALRALETRRIGWWWLSILAAALLTGAKASNLPLVLPLAVSWWPLRRLAIRNSFRSSLVFLLAVGVSFLPMAVLNQLHFGQWAGDMSNSSGVQVSNPLAGVAGNTLELAVNTSVPPIFPLAERWNSEVVPSLMGMPAIDWIRSQFPRIYLETRELTAEEGAGLGIGIAILWMILLFAAFGSRRQIPVSRRPKPGETPWLAWGITGSGLIAFGVFFAKMGSEADPRILAPYYPILLFAVLLLVGGRHLTRERWWLGTTYAVALIPVVLLIVQPARPLFPADLVVRIQPKEGALGSLSSRIATVYQTYQARADALAPLRNLIPDSVHEIGFIGTANNPEVSLWRPFGQRKVRDIVNPFDPVSLPDFVAVSQSYLKEKTARPIEQWAQVMGMEEVGCVKVTLLVRDGLENWCVYRRRWKACIASDAGLVVLDVPLRGDSGERSNVGPSAIGESPDRTLAGDRIFPNQSRLAGAEKVSRTCDVPLSWDSGKRDNPGPGAVAEGPDRPLAGDRILPNQARLASAE